MSPQGKDIQVSATLRLRAEVLTKYREIAGLTSDVDLARRMEIDPTTVYRVLNGRTVPSAKFIASLPAAFKGVGLDELWEVVRTDTTDTESEAAA